MSVKNVQGLSERYRTLRKGYEDAVFSVDSTNTWVRNQAWPTLTQPSSSSEVVTGLYAVWPNDGVTGLGNFFAVNCAGNYTVDQGDGTIVSVNSGVQRDYEYNFNSSSLYDATVSFNSSTSTVNRNSHNYVNGDRVRFYRLVTASYITENQFYYVINSTVNSFQISLTSGGSAVTFSTNGSASLLPFKIATVTITPQSGQSLTTVNLFLKHSLGALLPSGYSTGWLDLAISGPQISSLSISGNSSSIVRHLYMERCNIYSLRGNLAYFPYMFAFSTALRSVYIDSGITGIADLTGMFQQTGIVYAPMFDTSSVTNMASMFNNASQLKYVPLYNTSKVTNMSSMFLGCSSLVTVPEFDTSLVTNFGNMFNMSTSTISSLAYVPTFKTAKANSMNAMFSGCTVLVTCPYFETSGVTAMNGMFSGCTALRSVPFLNTGQVTSMTNMFNGCRSLTYVPCFDTTNVTTVGMQGMFTDCTSLSEIPELNTSQVTSMQSMFSGCSSIRTIPALNTALVTTMANMFTGCGKLESVPLLNTQNVTTMTGMFSGCSSLKSVPSFNTANVANMSSMFTGCVQLESVPLFDTTSVNTMANMFQNCYRLENVPLYNTSAVTNMSSMFSSCNNLRGIPLFNTVSVTTMASMFQNCFFLRTVPELNTAAVTSVASMFNTCSALNYVPAFNLNAVTSVANCANFVANCSSLSRVQSKSLRFGFSLANAKLSRTAIEEVFSNLPTPATSQTITITGNYGIDISTSKSVATTAGSTTLNISDTSGLSTGMIIHSGTGTGISTGITVTADVATDTITSTGYSLPNGTVVSFSALGTVTGVTTWTTYYVINSVSNTFQVSLTLNGSAIDLTGTNNSSVVVRYASYITSINPNVSITLSTPLATSGSNRTLVFRTLNTANALLRNWAITF